MKKQSSLFILLLICTFSFAQEVKVLPEMKLNITKLVSADDNQVIYRVQDQFGLYLNKFTVFDSKTGISEEIKVESVKYKGANGIPVNFFVKDGYLYELLLFKGSQTKEGTYNGMIKRDLKGLAQVGELIIIDKIDQAYFLAGQSAELILGEKGFYVVAGAKHILKHYIKKLTYDLKEEWSKELDFLDVEGASVAKIKVDNNDQILLTLIFSEKPKSEFFSFKYPAATSSALVFLNFDSTGEAFVMTPQFENTLNVRDYDFRYYDKEKVVIGVFSTTKVVDEKKNETAGIGYAYMVWDLEGNLLRSKNHYLTFKDLDGPELQQRLSTLKMVSRNPLASGKELPTINMNQNFNVFFQPDGSILIAHNDFYPIVFNIKDAGVSYYSSNLVYRINNQGELMWTKFFARDQSIGGTVGPDEYILKGGNLHMYVGLSSDYLTSDEIELQSELKKHEDANSSIFVVERIVNVNSGETISFKPILKEPIPKKHSTYRYTLSDKVLFSYFSNKKMNLVYIKR